MDAVKFLEEKDRMCRFYETCSKCPCFYKSGIAVNCILANGLSLAENKEQVAIVEKWSKEHPRKIRQSVFLEQYPNSLIDDEGILKINPCHINKNFNHFFSKNYCETSCTICRRNYWSEEVE